MDTVVLAAKSYHKSRGSELNISGTYPADKYTKDVFVASGLVRHLNANKDLQKTNILKFQLVAGKNGDQKSDIVATKLTNYFNNCLGTQNYRLTDEGENQLAEMFGEVIDNCERHGGEKSVWYALGHYQIRDEFECGEIQLTIFDFGDSIYERLLDKSTSEETKNKLRMMDAIHQSLYDNQWNREMMYTVFSLQEGISRLRDKKREVYSNRGQGTITLMDTFYHLGQTTQGLEPELTLVSGNVHIRFKVTHFVKTVF